MKSTSVVTPLDGLRARFGAERVTHSDGIEDEQVVAAADLVVVVVGYTKHDEGEYIDNAGTIALAGDLFPPMDHPELGFQAPEPESSDAAEIDPPPSDDSSIGGMSPGGDRSSLRLGAADEELIAAATALSDRVVVVVQCGSAVMMPWASSAGAVLVTWYAGVEGGHALGDVLVGDREPAGRLPFVIPTDSAHLVHFDKDATEATYELLHGQWHLDAEGHVPQFPFGAGRGYASFEISPIVSVDDGAAITVEVSNTSDRDGSTVVFVFAGVDDSSVARPAQRLVGFQRVAVEARGTRRVTIALDWPQLDVRRDGGWWTEPGRYRLVVGRHAGDVAAEVAIDRGR